jgi:hypothetical protein
VSLTDEEEKAEAFSSHTFIPVHAEGLLSAPTTTADSSLRSE